VASPGGTPGQRKSFGIHSSSSGRALTPVIWVSTAEIKSRRGCFPGRGVPQSQDTGNQCRCCQSKAGFQPAHFRSSGFLPTADAVGGQAGYSINEFVSSIKVATTNQTQNAAGNQEAKGGWFVAAGILPAVEPGRPARRIKRSHPRIAWQISEPVSSCTVLSGWRDGSPPRQTRPHRHFTQSSPACSRRLPIRAWLARAGPERARVRD
jgi:hypothetical protein